MLVKDSWLSSNESHDAKVCILKPYALSPRQFLKATETITLISKAIHPYKNLEKLLIHP